MPIKLSIKLATGKQAQSTATFGKLQFKIGEYQIATTLRVLLLGIFDGILGMDWLVNNGAILECKAKQLKFQTLLGE